MKVLGIMYLAIYILLFATAKIKVSGVVTNSLWLRFVVVSIFSTLLTVILGLPLLGLLYLLGL